MIHMTARTPDGKVIGQWQRDDQGNLIERQFPQNCPEIVCLCGSTRFMDDFYAANMRETLAGKIVLTVGMSPSGDCRPDEDTKVKLDALHFRKIELADSVLVLNVGGYIGQSTRNEIEHAVRMGKPVRYLE